MVKWPIKGPIKRLTKDQHHFRTSRGSNHQSWHQYHEQHSSWHYCNRMLRRAVKRNLIALRDQHTAQAVMQCNGQKIFLSPILRIIERQIQRETVKTETVEREMTIGELRCTHDCQVQACRKRGHGLLRIVLRCWVNGQVCMSQVPLKAHSEGIRRTTEDYRP